jgi:hypothetical protein
MDVEEFHFTQATDLQKLRWVNGVLGPRRAHWFLELDFRHTPMRGDVAGAACGSLLTALGQVAQSIVVKSFAASK